MKTARILVVEDNGPLRRAIVRALSASWSDVDAVPDGRRALERLADRDVEPYHVVVTDLRLPGAAGDDVLRAARSRDPRTAVLLMSAHGTIEGAVEAMKLGAHDFLQKPFELEQLELRVERAVASARLVAEVRSLREERAARFTRERIVGDSAALREASRLALRVAPSRSTVLVTGETGTGKELIASLIHGASPRADGPFVKVNCAALPETLLESELFGHERGAFTGADQPRVGRFEQADGGTLFLDEVADMSLATQAKLLRVLQGGEFHRLGSVRAQRADVRIVAATNRELEEAVREGSFRGDLFFRLHVIRIHLPPLRERGEDAVVLARHFVELFRAELGRPELVLDDAAAARIARHPWPGNVRELRNVMERAVLLADGARIGPDDVGLDPEGASGAAAWRPGLPPAGLPFAEVERAVVLEALERAHFVQKDAAARLGLSRRKLNYMIARMGITHPSWRRNRGEGDEEGPSVEPSGIG